MRPINNVVDITNYVMFDLGRPLHVYDRAKLSGGLVARKAMAGEQVLALNGKTYTLTKADYVIQDGSECLFGMTGLDVPAPAAPKHLEESDEGSGAKKDKSRCSHYHCLNTSSKIAEHLQ